MNKEILYRFFNGSTTFEEEVKIKEWMELSVENKRTFFHERKIFDALTIIPSPETISVPESATNKPTRRIWLKEFLKIASVILLTFSSTIGLQHYTKSKQPIAMQTISVPAGQYISLKLPDGTAVWLNSRSTLRYPISFNTQERKIELDGEAYFEVAKNEDLPFIVCTDKYDVEVLGTKFNVEAYKDKGSFIASLMEGSVKIQAANESVNLVLKPETKAVYEKERLLVYQIDDYNPYRWREGLISFKNASFASIMRDFEKYYGVSIQIRNKEVNKYNYTGKFRQTDGVDYALRVLQRDIKFKYIKDDELQIISIE